jgi:hypothetical protein
MAKKENKSVFTAEFALKTDKHQERKLNLKFDGMTSLYNQLLKFLLKQHEKLKKDSDYIKTVDDYHVNKKSLIESQNAIFLLEKKLKEEKNDEQKENLLKLSLEEEKFETLKKEKLAIQKRFSDLNIHYHLDYPFIEKLSTNIKKSCWMQDHLDSQTIQVVAKTIYQTYEKWRYKNGGKPRFKTEKRCLKSICGKQNACIIIDKKGLVKWTSLKMEMIEEKNVSGFQSYAKQKIAEGNLKYSRIVRRIIKGKHRFFVQFVIEGKPLIKEKNKTPTENIGKTVGLDIGVSSLGVASAMGGFLFPFAPTVKDHYKEIKKIQRAMSRSSRENNPDCFHETIWVKKVKHTKKKLGKVKKKSRLKKRSKNYIKLQAKLKDYFRKMETARNQEHYLLINILLQLGLYFKIEKNNFKAWMKSWFGRAIGKKSPSTFQAKLINKAVNAGGEVSLISPYKPKFSQYCHVCHSYHKKPLSQRTHICESNGEAIAQRDVYSAFLIYHYDIMKNEHHSTQEDFDLFKDLTLKNSKWLFSAEKNHKSYECFKLFPQLNFSVNDMGGGVAGGKFYLTDEAKGYSFCAAEESFSSGEESDLQNTYKTLIPAFGAVDRKKVKQI